MKSFLAGDTAAMPLDMRGRSNNVEEVRYHDSQEIRAPSLPVPSVYAKKSFIFQQFKSSCPQLLTEVNRIVDVGLSQLRKDGREGTVDARLAVYRAAFQRFIDDFNIYRPFLQSVKTEYDSSIDVMLNRLGSVSTAHCDFAVKDEEHAIAVRILRKLHSSEMKTVKDQNIALNATIAAKEEEMRNIEFKSAFEQTKNTKLQQELKEAKKLIAILAKALHLLEEDKTKRSSEDQAISAEIIALNSSAQKSQEEIERYVCWPVWSCSHTHHRDALIIRQDYHSLMSISI